MRVLAYRMTAEGEEFPDNDCCGPSKVKKNSECDNDSQKVRLRLTLNHALSVLVNMLSLTFVIGLARMWVVQT